MFQNLLVNLSLFLKKKISQIDTNQYDCHISPLDLTDLLGLHHLLDLINRCQTIKVPKIQKHVEKISMVHLQGFVKRWLQVVYSYPYNLSLLSVQLTSRLWCMDFTYQHSQLLQHCQPLAIYGKRY